MTVLISIIGLKLRNEDNKEIVIEVELKVPEIEVDYKENGLNLKTDPSGEEKIIFLE
ncbi:hypothetical protein ACFLTD_01420 [Elusimicrobiota bacterium]